MVFKSVAYRLGYGKNIKGNFEGEYFKIFYKSRDGQVQTKDITRRAGRVELTKGEEVYNATTVVPLAGGRVMSKQNREIKSIKI